MKSNIYVPQPLITTVSGQKDRYFIKESYTTNSEPKLNTSTVKTSAKLTKTYKYPNNKPYTTLEGTTKNEFRTPGTYIITYSYKPYTVAYEVTHTITVPKPLINVNINSQQTKNGTIIINDKFGGDETSLTNVRSGDKKKWDSRTITGPSFTTATTLTEDTKLTVPGEHTVKYTYLGADTKTATFEVPEPTLTWKSSSNGKKTYYIDDIWSESEITITHDYKDGTSVNARSSDSIEVKYNNGTNTVGFSKESQNIKDGNDIIFYNEKFVNHGNFKIDYHYNVNNVYNLQEEITVPQPTLKFVPKNDFSTNPKYYVLQDIWQAGTITLTGHQADKETISNVFAANSKIKVMNTTDKANTKINKLKDVKFNEPKNNYTIMYYYNDYTKYSITETISIPQPSVTFQTTTFNKEVHDKWDKNDLTITSTTNLKRNDTFTNDFEEEKIGNGGNNWYNDKFIKNGSYTIRYKYKNLSSYYIDFTITVPEPVIALKNSTNDTYDNKGTTQHYFLSDT